MDDLELQAIKQRYSLLAPFLTENLRRRLAAAEALTLGYGGISVVARETGLSRGAIALGCKELKNPDDVDPARVRRKGGGRKQVLVKDPTLGSDLERLLEPTNSIDPALRWTCKSVRALAAELGRWGHRISHNCTAELLRDLGYSLRGNQKSLEGVTAADRNRQFAYINCQVAAFQARGLPVVFAEIRRKALRDLTAEAPVCGWDDATDDAGGWIGAPLDQEATVFAVNGIHQWWYSMLRSLHPAVSQILLVVDSGGSDTETVQWWRRELQRLSDELGLTLTVAHLPPGTSRWRGIEQRQVAISQSQRDSAPISQRSVVGLVASPDIPEPAPTLPGTLGPLLRLWNYTLSAG